MVIKLFIFLSWCILSFVSINTSIEKKSVCTDPTNLEITLRDGTTTPDPSVQRLVQAYLDFDMEEIVVQFNASVGNEVTVTITSLTGATVSMVMCDSDLESLVSLPIPPKGAYILRVESATYQGEGTFTVQ